MKSRLCDRGHVTDRAFVTQARIDCISCAQGNIFKEQAESAQALREDYGNTYEQGYVSCLYDSEARHLQALRTSTLTWKCRDCDAVPMYK